MCVAGTLTVRFPEGITEFTLAAETPKVGDTLRRRSDEWKAVAVETDGSGGDVVVTLVPLTPGANGNNSKKAAN